MPLLKVGFFRELPHGDPSGPSLTESRGKLPPHLRQQASDYTRKGAILATTGQLTEDWFSKRANVAPLQVLTDGVWAWPADLAYYIDHYLVAVPDDFIQHMSELSWQTPHLSDEELMAAVDKFLSRQRAT